MQMLKAGLYIVSTPIGNLKDITYRAVETLTASDVIICEDTRQTAKLLRHYSIPTKKLIIYNDHAEESDRQKILNLLLSDKIVSLVSDAGTPLISDPGYKLIKFLHENNIYITAVPGASSPITALTLSGLPTNNFYFGGFIPQKNEAKKTFFKDVIHINSTLIFFESANRIAETLNVIAEIFPSAECAIVREITKMFEQRLAGKAAQLQQRLLEKEIKGEIVLLINNQSDAAAPLTDGEIKQFLASLLAKYPISDAAKIGAKELGIKKQEAYAMLLALK